MSDGQDLQSREFALLKQFRDGSIIYHFGVFMDDTDIQDKGLGMKRAAIEGLETLRPDGLFAILPMLEDPDPGVQSGAASSLLDTMPERAIPVLENLKDGENLEAATTARLTLLVYTMEMGGDFYKYA
jgi:hypothetical protein